MRRAALVLSAATAALALAGCSGGSSIEEGTAAPDALTFASWSLPVEPAGEWLNSMANDELRVDLYLLGVEAAPEDSSWSDSQTDEPTFVAGDDVMLLQYVLTNVGDAEITLPGGEGSLSIDFQGNDYVSVPQEHHLGDMVAPYGFLEATPVDYTQDLGGDFDLPLAPGESVTAASVFWFPADEELTATFEVDRFVEGEIDYDDHVIDGTVALPVEP